MILLRTATTHDPYNTQLPAHRTPTQMLSPPIFPACSRRPRRQPVHSWYDTDHGQVLLRWCRLHAIRTHPQINDRTIRRRYTSTIRRRLFYYALKTLCPQADFRRRQRPSTSQRRRLRRRRLGPTTKRKRRPSTTRQHTFINPRPPTKTPSVSQIIQELLQLSPGLKGGGKGIPDVVPDLYPV